MVCMSLLPLTDEASTGVLNLCMGMAWLVEPSLLGRTRRDGLLMLAGMGVAFLGLNLVFSGSLSPGGPVQKVLLVAPRSPGVQQPPLPLTGAPGWVALITDTVPMWTSLIGIVVVVLRGRGEGASRTWRGFLTFVGVLFVVSLFGLICVQINNAPVESHRFLTAALFITPLMGLLVATRLPAGSLPWTSIVAGLVVGGMSTILWASHYANGHATPQWYFQQKGKTNLHETNCRESAGSRLGDKPRPTYVESRTFYAYVGCRPSFVAGKGLGIWVLKYAPVVGIAGLQNVDRELAKPDETIDAICPSGWAVKDLDPVCAHVMTHAKCEAQGTDFMRCPLTPADRTLLGGPRPPTPPKK
jgi:hypothetical protein